jgi:hypothetical protein
MRFCVFSTTMFLLAATGVHADDQVLANTGGVVFEIPEPVGLALLGIGLGAIALRLRQSLGARARNHEDRST